jgi:hypothetical protein
MSFGPGYACAGCKVKFRPRKNDIRVLETMDDGRPYRVWCADLWECPDCGTQLIAGYGRTHISEHYMDGFGEALTKVTHTIDCCLKTLP